jgi:ferritin-like metal-binding protein YciE
MADDKNTNTIQQYVGDMVALESHIEEALDGQLKESLDHPGAKAAIQRFHNTVKMNRDALKMHLEQIGGSESHPVKDAFASLFGKAAGVIDNVRTKTISKSLRDDYTAFNHAAIGYSMLHVTAHALGDMRTMEVAERHLRAYAQAVQEINQLIAEVVVWELNQEEGLRVNDDVVRHCTDAINRVWRETAPAQDPMRRAA